MWASSVKAPDHATASPRGRLTRRNRVSKGNSSRRGLINVALNGLVSTGVIAGFRTNYTTRGEPDQLQITVTSPSGARQESIRAKVLQRSAKARRLSSNPVVDSPLADEHPGCFD